MIKIGSCVRLSDDQVVRLERIMKAERRSNAFIQYTLNLAKTNTGIVTKLKGGLATIQWSHVERIDKLSVGLLTEVT